jgi:hypothetical protein
VKPPFWKMRVNSPGWAAGGGGGDGNATGGGGGGGGGAGFSTVAETG